MLEKNNKIEKLKKISLIVRIFILLILEIIIMLLFSKNEAILNFRSLFWIFHFLVTISFVVHCNYLREDIGYYDIFIILFPVGGAFIFFINEIFSGWKVEKAIAEEILEKRDKKRKLKKSKYEYLIEEFDVMSSYDMLLSENNDGKKKFLFSYETDDEAVKVGILQRALLDENTDVIHYAATELNKIDSTIQENINKAEKAKEKTENEEERKKLEYKIYELYKKYLKSGLLFDEIFNFYQAKSLELLEELDIDEKKKELEKIELYEIMADKKEEYEKLLKKRIDSYCEEKIITKYLKFLYKENRFEEVIKEYRNYTNKLGNENQIEKPIFLESLI